MQVGTLRQETFVLLLGRELFVGNQHLSPIIMLGMYWK